MTVWSWPTPAVPSSSRKPPMEKMAVRRRLAMPGNLADRQLTDPLTGGTQHKAVLQGLPLEIVRVLFFNTLAASPVSDAERSLESTTEAFGADQSKLTRLIFNTRYSLS